MSAARARRFNHAKVDAAEKAELERQEIWSDDDLWRVVGEDFERGIYDLSSRTGIAADRLLEILTDCALREPPLQRVVARHALDLIVVSALLLLLVLFWRAWS